MRFTRSRSAHSSLAVVAAGFAAGLLAIAAPSVAFAQGAPAPSGGIADGTTRFVVSADRLMGLFAYESTTTKETVGPNVVEERTSSGPGFSFLLGGNRVRDNFHNQPRVGFDVVLPTPITIGGSIPFATTLGGNEEVKRSPGGTTSRDGAGLTLFGFAPRVGYLLTLSDAFSFWPRAGFAYYSASSTTKNIVNNIETETSITSTAMSIDLDPQFVIHPVPHVGFNVGPLINIPVGGSQEVETKAGPTTTTRENDLSIFHFGLTLGMLVYF